jgi:hypothetical protein
MVSLVKAFLVCALCLVAAGCSRDDTPFLPLDKLCTAYAEEVCEARRNCGCPEPVEACEERVGDACEVTRDMLNAEKGFVYDGERADRVRDQLRKELLECTPPFELTRFFVGPAKAGEACDRASECESLRCEGEPSVCAATDPAPLCEEANS